MSNEEEVKIFKNYIDTKKMEWGEIIEQALKPQLDKFIESKMENLKNFEIQLVNAVRYATLNENPTNKEIKEIKKKLMVGLTNQQFDLVKRVYNSTLKSIAFENAKALLINHALIVGRLWEQGNEIKKYGKELMDESNSN